MKNIFLFMLSALLFSPCLSQAADNVSDNVRKGLELIDKGEYKSASKIFDDTCNAGDGFACSISGFIYAMGDGKTKDMPKALSAYKKACSLKDASGCYNAAYIYLQGTDVPKDKNKAAVLFETSCALGAGRGCFDLATLYETGDDIKKDVAKASAFFKKACELGYKEGCERSKPSDK